MSETVRYMRLRGILTVQSTGSTAGEPAPHEAGNRKHPCAHLGSPGSTVATCGDTQSCRQRLLPPGPLPLPHSIAVASLASSF